LLRRATASSLAMKLTKMHSQKRALDMIRDYLLYYERHF
jgi:hypothetical protein